MRKNQKQWWSTSVAAQEQCGLPRKIEDVRMTEYSRYKTTTQINKQFPSNFTQPYRQ